LADVFLKLKKLRVVSSSATKIGAVPAVFLQAMQALEMAAQFADPVWPQLGWRIGAGWGWLG
jgi:hypothetical protein